MIFSSIKLQAFFKQQIEHIIKKHCTSEKKVYKEKRALLVFLPSRPKVLKTWVFMACIKTKLARKSERAKGKGEVREDNGELKNHVGKNLLHLSTVFYPHFHFCFFIRIILCSVLQVFWGLPPVIRGALVVSPSHGVASLLLNHFSGKSMFCYFQCTNNNIGLNILKFQNLERFGLN